MENKNKTSSQLQGLTRLVMEATTGIIDLVEAMHKQIVHPPLLPSTPIQHMITRIAGITYKSIRWGTRFVGGSLDHVLGQFGHLIGEIKTSDEREAIRSALNGVVGDYLEENENPLKINMQFRFRSKAITLERKQIAKAYPTINGKILLMVHGSCMNDIQWTRKEHNHGEELAKELNKTPIYLHYNTGRHISTNGQNLSELLGELVQQWPLPIDEIVIIAHSMGGLVVRSALHYSEQYQVNWTKHVKKIIFLGTPHHGSPLERMGNYLDNILEAIPYAKPFARLGKIRSAGVTDLRFGYLIDEDWNDKDRFELQEDQRRSISLPENITCYAIAAATVKATNSKSSRKLGDGLVDVKSALGYHENPDFNLQFKESNTLVVYESSHLDLLSNLEIYDKTKSWLV